jgi:hypothetical protein
MDFSLRAECKDFLSLEQLAALEVSPIKSDAALYIFLSVSVICLLSASMSFGCSSTNGNRCKNYWSHSIFRTLPSLWPLKLRVSPFFLMEANVCLSA